MSQSPAPKIYFLAELKTGPWGGGNQFLSNLKYVWQKEGFYTENLLGATHILYNSYQNLTQAVDLKKSFPEKIFIHRLGPIFHCHRGGKWKKIDQAVVKVAEYVADLLIFQSRWSFQETSSLGFHRNNYAIIGNAPDPATFKRKEKKPFNVNKIKLISTSWSDNLNKGFSFFQYLDEHLDFNHYAMTFIGNSPFRFKNIKSLPPMDSPNIAKELRQADIFIAPFQHEAASNSILEALSCGLPVAAIDSGGNIEEVKNGGELFVSMEEMMDKIKKIAYNYQDYQKRIQCATIQEIADHYKKVAVEIDRTSQDRPPFWLPHYIKWKTKSIH